MCGGGGMLVCCCTFNFQFWCRDVPAGGHCKTCWTRQELRPPGQLLRNHLDEMALTCIRINEAEIRNVKADYLTMTGGLTVVFVSPCSTAAPLGVPHAFLEGHSGLLRQHHGVRRPVREVHECRWTTADGSQLIRVRILSFPSVLTQCVCVCVQFMSWWLTDASLTPHRSSSSMWRTFCAVPLTSPGSLRSGRQPRWSWTHGTYNRTVCVRHAHTHLYTHTHTHRAVAITAKLQ